MQHVHTGALAKRQENTVQDLPAITERMSLALEGSRQIAFDWHIPDDRLYFSGELADGLQGVPIDATATWHSALLPALIHADDRTNFRRRLRDALKGDSNGHGFYRIELRLTDTVRGWRWVDIRGTVVERGGDGRALRMVGTFSDIDERKRAEEKIERRRSLYAVLSQINQAIVRLNDSDALLREVCRLAVEHGGFRLAWVGLTDRHGQKIVIAAAHGEHAELLPHAVIRPDGAPEEGPDMIGAALRHNRPNVCNDIGAVSESRHSGSLVMPPEVTSAASLPFLFPDRRCGVLNLYATGQDFFDASLVDLLEEMTTDISFALDVYAREAQRCAAEAALKQNQAALRDNALRYRQLVELSPQAIFVFQEARMTLLNQAAAHLLGAGDRTDLLGRSAFDFVHPDHRHLFQERPPLPSAAPAAPFVEQIWFRSDGTRFHAEIAATALTYNDAPAMQVVVRDISERKRNEAIQLGQNRILNMIATGSALPDILAEILRFAESHSSCESCSILRLEDNGAASGSAPPPARSSWPILGRNGKALGALAPRFRETAAATGEDLPLLRICADLAGIAIESRAAEEKIRYLAHYDGLTALPNRFLFKEYLDLALRSAERHRKKFAVLFLDLDKFKDINDTLGHQAGDQVLREIADRLRKCLRSSDRIARMGGDEFYVLIEELGSRHCAAEVAQKLLDAAAMPLQISGRQCLLGVSIGIGIYPDDGGDAQTLLKNADQAMYRAKAGGKNGFQFHAAREQNDESPSLGSPLPPHRITGETARPA